MLLSRITTGRKSISGLIRGSWNPDGSFSRKAKQKSRKALRCTAGRICRDLRASEKAPGAERIYTAGEKEYLAWQDRRDKGVPIGEALQKEFTALRDECGLDIVFPFEK